VPVEEQELGSEQGRFHHIHQRAGVHVLHSHLKEPELGRELELHIHPKKLHSLLTEPESVLELDFRIQMKWEIGHRNLQKEQERGLGQELGHRNHRKELARGLE